MEPEVAITIQCQQKSRDEMGKSNGRPMLEYKMRKRVIMKKEEKDLGVITQDTLNSEATASVYK